MNSNGISDRERIETLLEFAPVAYETAKMHVEADLGDLWKQQVRQLRDWRKTLEEDVDIDDDEGDSDDQSDFEENRWPRVSSSESRVSVKIYDDKGNKTDEQTVPILYLPRVADKPRSYIWTAVDRNIRVPCQSTKFAGEESDDEDDILKKVLMESAGEVGEAKKSSVLTPEDLRNDQAFTAFVETLMDLEDKTLKDPVMESNVFVAINEMCPKAGFPFEIRERYLTLKGSTSVPNKPRSETIRELSRKKIMEPYHKKFCRRCYVYNCLVHGVSQKVDIKTIALKDKAFDEENDASPCKNCYKSVTSTPPLPVAKTSAAPSRIPSPPLLPIVVSSAAPSPRPPSAVEENIPPPIVSSEDGDIQVLSDDDEVSCLYQLDRKGDRAVRKELIQFESATWLPLNAAELGDDSVDSIQDKTLRYFHFFANWQDSAKAQENETVQQICDSVAPPVSEANDMDPSEEGSLFKWTDDEIAMYLALKIIFPKQFCTIAKIIQSKDCRQVFEFAAKEKFDCSIDNTTQGPCHTKESLQTQARSWHLYCQKHGLHAAKKAKPEMFPLYIPCNHEGPCTLAVCPCLINRIPCEKFCFCFKKFRCKNQFPGCSCTDGCGSKCRCLTGQRECDVDLCECRMCAIGENGNENKGRLDTPMCSNACIQRLEKKSVRVGRSRISGWGLFADEPFDKDEFIGEYIGEIISIAETERRGSVYDQNKHTFMFTKDDSHTIDGMHFGNLTRFMNSSRKPNCYPMVKSVYGDMRVGIYALRNIEVGDELTFDYMNVIEQTSNSDEVASTSERGKVASKYCRPRDASTGDAD